MALLRSRQPARLEALADLEARLRADPEVRAGLRGSVGGAGHPEGSVAEHVEEVLANLAGDADPRLRIVALVHDSMKHRVRWWLPGRTDHARLAARFAARYTDDPSLLKVIARHDDAYRAWRFGRRWRLWPIAEWRARRLADDLGDDLELFRTFYRADNETGGKTPDDRLWFEALVSRAAPPRRPRSS